MEDATTVPAIRLKLLGGFSALGPGGEMIDIIGQKDRALLAYLALSPGVSHGRDKLAALLWSDSGERQARDSLKQCLLRLRRALARACPDAIAGDRQTVTFEVDGIAVDAALFARMAAGEDEIDRAITLYQGDLLDGVSVRAAAFEDWLLVERQRLRQLAIDSFSKSLALAQTAGQRDRAAAAARRLLSLDPLQEGACRALMQIHADRAERAQALKLFEALRDRLQQELRVKPEPETIRLYESIKQQRAACSTAATPAPPHAAAEVSTSLTPTPQPSIAVLPFINGGDDPEQEYFADGLTEQIINDLSRISALSVIARHTVFAYKGKSLKVPELARELGVDFILEGSVRKSGGRLRVTAQLIDGGSGGHSWSMRYDRSLSDIFALQEEIAKTIVDVLKVRLLPAELESITSRSTANPAAYEYYLMGRSFYLRGIDRRNWRIARQMYAKASELDPAFAAAYAGMAICDSHLLMGDPGISPEAILVNGRRALELMPDLAEAHAAIGLAHILSGRHDEADAAFARAVELNPDLFEANFFWADSCQLRGFHDRATELFARAAELRPNDFRSVGLLATQYKDLNRPDDAMAASRRCLERVEAEIRQHPDNAGALAFGAITLAELGQASQAEDWAARAIIIGPDDHLVQYNVACALVMLGRLDTAVDHLERAFAASPAFRLWLSSWMRSDSDFDPLRRHPRFQALEERLQAESAVGAAPNSHRPSVAVLPFVNIAGDPEQDYFADGLTEDLITDLSQVSSLFVVARHTVYAYKGQDLSVEQAAREMKVRYVLEGSVRQEDRRMRVAVRLVDTGTGDHLWSNRYDRDIDDVFALQDEISKSIVDTLRV
ncbi:MAG TPA: BTAD domain-containing putative transcriptional regulator, partial [Dongiaceae bacterium]